MSIYSNEFKLKVVKYCVEEHHGVKDAAKHFSIPAFSTVRKWVNKYNEHGEKGLVKNLKSSYSGEFVCKEVRKTSDVPIIMVTSRDNEIDELMSLNYGADQYVTKPYNIQILLAKINGLLKRNQKQEKDTQKIDCDGFFLNIAERTIEKDDKKLELTKNEYNILYYLSINKGKIVSRDDIMDYLWESEEFIDDNTLSVNVKRLRNKLEELGFVDKIETRRGQGYILV